MRHLFYMLLLLFLLTNCAFSKRKSQKYFDKALIDAPYDAIIIPGVPHDGVSWSPTMNIRISWANFLFKKGIANNIIFSGGAVYTKFSEAKIMAEYGKALGVPMSSIFLDTNAEHSTENVYYSYLIAKKQGFTRIALATDPFQAKSLQMMIKKHNLPIDILPILFDTLRTIDRPEPTIFPEIAIENSFVSITERESFFTRVKGTMGKQIIWFEEDLPNDRKVRKYKRKGRVIAKGI